MNADLLDQRSNAGYLAPAPATGKRPILSTYLRRSVRSKPNFLPSDSVEGALFEAQPDEAMA